MVDASSPSGFGPREWVLFLAISSIWGASFVFIDIGLDALEPSAVTLIRVALGAATLGLLRGAPAGFRSADRWRMVALSIVWVGIPFTLFPLAEQHIDSATTGMLNGGTPMYTALVGAVWFSHRPTRALIAGLIVGFTGIALISAPALGEGSSSAIGVAMVVAATICYAFAANMAAPLIQRYGSLVVMRAMLSLAVVWTLPWGIVGIARSSCEWGPTVAVVVLGVVGTGLAYWVMAALVGRVGAPRAAFINYLIPVVAMALGVAFRGDQVPPVAVGGVALVIAGAVLAGRSRR